MRDKERQELLDHLAVSGIRIPPQPKVLLELRDLITRGNYDHPSICRVIAQDPGIVAMLFKAVHSPAFECGKEVDTIDQVLTTIGVKQVYHLVQAAALPFNMSDQKRKAFDVFWSRAHEVAQLAAIIAEDNITVCNVFPEHAYMAGVFHKCGVPLLMMRFPDYCHELHLEDGNCWPDMGEEDRKFNVDHVSIGYLVTRHWTLPDYVCKAILHHQDMPDEEWGLAISLVCILQLAIQFYQRMNNQRNPMWPTIGPHVLDEVGIGKNYEDEYFDDTSRRFLMEIDVPSYQAKQDTF